MSVGVNGDGYSTVSVCVGENRHTWPQEAGCAPVSLGIRAWCLSSTALSVGLTRACFCICERVYACADMSVPPRARWGWAGCVLSLRPD